MELLYSSRKLKMTMRKPALYLEIVYINTKRIKFIFFKIEISTNYYLNVSSKVTKHCTLALTYSNGFCTKAKIKNTHFFLQFVRNLLLASIARPLELPSAKHA